MERQSKTISHRKDKIFTAPSSCNCPIMVRTFSVSEPKEKETKIVFPLNELPGGGSVDFRVAIAAKILAESRTALIHE